MQGVLLTKRAEAVTVEVQTFYGARSGTAKHSASCRASFSCTVIDPVFDLDPKSGHTTRAPVDAVVGFIRENDLKLG